ncbi:MAG: sigma-70 family RNA polymerase sigma factor [Oscillospiraceae bacterium]|nr:sigma-70 family RNA polymerase sigma factor [Oscillospiraceae bacterium]
MADLPTTGGRTVRDVYTQHARMLYRIAYTYMKNSCDSEDALQECFLRYIRSGVSFADPQHEKGWLILTLTNICRDMLRSRARRHDSLEDHAELTAAPPETDRLTAAVLALPDRYKAPLYLFYYEGYSVKEIAGMLHQPVNTVKTRLARARKLLKNEWEEQFDEG